MSDSLRVVLAEDHYLVREGTRQLLENSGEVEVLASVGTVVELDDAVDRLRGVDGHPDAAQLMEGIEAAHRIRATHPEIGVVVLSQHADEAYAFELLEHGTDGLAYLLTDRIGNLDELVAALRAVVRGRSVIDPRVVEALVTRRARLRSSPLAQLSPRELEVLREMA